MRFACILLILSVFSFVPAAPVPAREVREARADAAGGGEDVIIVSGKRAPWADSDSDSDSDAEWWTPPPQSSPPPDHASGSHLGVALPSSSLGGTEVPLDSEGAFTPGTTTENQPASSSNTKKVNFWHTTKVHFFEPDLPASPEDQPASSSGTKSVSWAPSKVILPSGEIISEPLPPEPLSPETESLSLPPGREGYLAKVAAQQSPSPESEHASSSSSFDSPPYSSPPPSPPPPPPPPSPPPPRPPPPQSKGFVSKLKTFFGNVNNFKTPFGKFSSVNFRPRFQVPAYS